MRNSLFPIHLPKDQILATIGLVSDTHLPQRCGALPTSIFEVFEGVDLILHAGDVGELWVLDQLSKIAPVNAVHGNDDTVDAQRELPVQQVISIAGQRILNDLLTEVENDTELSTHKKSLLQTALLQIA